MDKFSNEELLKRLEPVCQAFDSQDHTKVIEAFNRQDSIDLIVAAVKYKMYYKAYTRLLTQTEALDKLISK